MSEAPPHAAESLPEARRIEYMIAVATVAFADGVASAEETTIVRELCRHAKLGEAAIETVLAAAGKEGDAARRHAAVAEMRDEGLGVALLSDAIVIAFVDGRLAAEETERLSEIAAELGLTVAQAGMIARYVEQSLAHDDQFPLSHALAEGFARDIPHLAPPHGVRWLFRKLKQR